MNQTELETRLVRALVDTAHRNLADAEVPPAFAAAGHRPDHRVTEQRGRWVRPLLAAAVLLALAVAGVLGANQSRRSPAPAAPPGPRPTAVVTLRAAAGSLDPAQLRQAQAIVRSRATALGADRPEVSIAGSDELVASLPGVSAREVTRLGAVDALAFRPLIVEPVSTRTAASPAPVEPRTLDPWRSLGFAPPRDAAGYDALSSARQRAIQAVLAGWNCAELSRSAADAPIVACDQEGSRAFLLGTEIVGADDYAGATLGTPDEPPNLLVDLRSSAQQRWTAYTALHNERRDAGAMANTVADVLDGAVLKASTVQEQIAGQTQVLTGLDRDSTAQLAAALPSAPLPVRFDVVSVQGG